MPLAERLHQPVDQQLQASGSGLRGSGAAGLFGPQPFGFLPYPLCREPKGKRVEVRFPDPSANPYLAFAAMLMAGLDGIQNKIHPGDAMDKNLYDLPPEELAAVPTVCGSLRQALDSLEADNDYLTKGDVFAPDMIEAYIELKRGEQMASKPRRTRSSTRCTTRSDLSGFRLLIFRAQGIGVAVLPLPFSFAYFGIPPRKLYLGRKIMQVYACFCGRRYGPAQCPESSMRDEPSSLPLRLTGVRYAVGGTTLIPKLDLTLAGHGITTILGPNGAGKSLTLRLCHGLIRPTAGAVEWLVRVRQPSTAVTPWFFSGLSCCVARRAAISSMRSPLLAKTIAPAASLPMQPSTASAWQRLPTGRPASFRVANSSVWLWRVRGRYVLKCCSLMNRPPISTRLRPRAVESMIVEFIRDGIRIVMTTHDLGQARRLADEVVFLNRGTLIEQTSRGIFFDQPRTEEAAAFLGRSPVLIKLNRRLFGALVAAGLSMAVGLPAVRAGQIHHRRIDHLDRAVGPVRVSSPPVQGEDRSGCPCGGQGTGQAIETGRRGDADVLFVHDTKSEEKFVADGFAGSATT